MPLKAAALKDPVVQATGGFSMKISMKMNRSSAKVLPVLLLKGGDSCTNAEREYSTRCIFRFLKMFRAGFTHYHTPGSSHLLRPQQHSTVVAVSRRFSLGIALGFLHDLPLKNNSGCHEILLCIVRLGSLGKNYTVQTLPCKCFMGVSWLWLG